MVDRSIAGYRAKPASATVLARSEVDLCPKGQVSFYGLVVGGSADAVRIPVDLDEQCMSCSELDGALGLTGGANPPKWAHTFAPRKGKLRLLPPAVASSCCTGRLLPVAATQRRIPGVSPTGAFGLLRAGMTQCIPCPGGTIPKADTDVNGNNIRAVCAACPNGQYRDAYIISATCIDCGPGMEVGPSSKMACTMWWVPQLLCRCQPAPGLHARAGDATCRRRPPACMLPPLAPAPAPAPASAPQLTPPLPASPPCSRPGYFNDRRLAVDQPDASLRAFEVNTCKACPAYFYRATQGALSCLPCPRGTQTANSGNVECTACPIGYYNNEPGTKCEAAKMGTFVNTTGAYVSTPW